MTGYSTDWIRCIVPRSNHGGPHALGDRRHANPGGTFLLSAAQQAHLQQALDEPPADGGLWSGPKVAQWILTQTGCKVHSQRGWEYLKRLGYSQRVLRPRHAKADPAAQEAFKNRRCNSYVQLSVVSSHVSCSRDEIIAPTIYTSFHQFN